MAGVVEPKDQVVDRDLIWRHPADVGQPLGKQPFMFALGSGCVELAEVKIKAAEPDDGSGGTVYL